MYFLKNILNQLLFIFGYLVLRNNTKFCFGGLGNRFSGNAQILFEYMSNQKEIECIWISRNKNIVTYLNTIGYKSHKKYSLKGLYHSYTARTYIYDCYISDINYLTSAGAFSINLWHGTPLKLIEHDIKSGPLSEVFNPTGIKKYFKEYMYPIAHKKHDVIFYGNEHERKIFSSCFRYNSLINCMSPRNVKLIDSKSLNKGSSVLFAPTWRSVGVELNNTFNDKILYILQDFCTKNNKKLCVSIHSASRYKVPDDISYTDVSGKSLFDIISECELLVTDFSSIMFDFLILNKNIILTCNDFFKYANSDRGFYQDIFNSLKKMIFDNSESFKEFLNDSDEKKFDFYIDKKLKDIINPSENCTNSLKEIFNIIDKKILT